MRKERSFLKILSLISLGFCSASITSPSLAALAPVESRTVHHNKNQNQNAVQTSQNDDVYSESNVSEPVASTPVFSGSNQLDNASSSSSTASALSPSVSSSKTVGTVGTSQDRAAHLTLTQIENLQREVSDLRGVVETQEHTIKQLKKSQQDLYLDLERRLNQLQTGGQSAGAGAKSSPGSKTAAASAALETAIASANATKTSKSGTSTTPAASAGTTQSKTSINANTNTNSASGNGNTATSTTSKLGDQETYQHAYSFVRSKKYPEAIAALQDYLNRFKKGEQAPHAHYWLGEVYMLQWQSDKNNQSLLDKAMQAFTSVTTEFPNHPKTADALLKLGLIEIDKGNPDNATQYLSEVKTRYPGSAAARIAENKLQQIAAD